MDQRLKEIVDNFDKMKIGLGDTFNFHCLAGVMVFTGNAVAEQTCKYTTNTTNYGDRAELCPTQYVLNYLKRRTPAGTSFFMFHYV